MELKEFVRLDPGKVRRDKELMQLFVEFYKAAFSFTPNCAGCVFKTGFRKLQRFAANDGKSVKFDKNILNMTTKAQKTFELKSKFRLKILTYRKDGKTYRSYGYNLTEDFARELVKSGKGDFFIKKPDQKPVQEIEVIDSKDIDSFEDDDMEIIGLPNYHLMDWKGDILPLYAKAKERTGKQAKSRKKADVIAFLEEHES